MTSIYSETLARTIEVNRIIGHLEGDPEGPTVVFFGGIHGNENSGVFALHDILEKLKKEQVALKGNIYALSGNLAALAEGERYNTEDLNRIWTSERLEKQANSDTSNLSSEAREQQEIYSIIENILKTEKGPFYFFDLHTTSSETVPFIILNDSILNRSFTSQYPLPMILGIEEYLEGPLLSHINELGYVSIGYEAGQHNSLSSYENQIAFINLSLVFAEVIDRKSINFNRFWQQQAKASITSRDVYEIKYRYLIHSNDSFEMKPGFVNFQNVKKGQELAESNGKKIIASHSGKIFMPLYQSQGTDGFFEIRRIPHFFLKLSELLRKTKVDHILPLMPGIRWASYKRDSLIVNLKVARFFAKQFMHLLGYRSKRIDKNHLVIKNRETVSKTAEYLNTEWIRG